MEIIGLRQRKKIKKCSVCGKKLELINGVYRHKYSLEEALNGKLCDHIEPVKQK